MKFRTIVVKDGMSIYDLAIRYYGSVNVFETILTDNNLSYDVDLYAGQKILIRVTEDNKLLFNEVSLLFESNNIDINNNTYNSLNNTVSNNTTPIKVVKAEPKVLPRESTTSWIVQDGQSSYDIVNQWYGSLEFIDAFLTDNNLTHDSDLLSGDVVIIRQTLIAAPLDNRAMNNNDNVTRSISALTVKVKSVGNEINGGDGYILIDVYGGTQPYTFLWTKSGDELFNRTTQNLTAVTAGLYYLTVTDAADVVAHITISISISAPVPVYDNWIDHLANTFTDEVGNRIYFVKEL